MTETTRDIAERAPKTGPWIVGYVVSIGGAFTAASSGVVSEPRTAMLFWIPIIACTAMIIYTSWRRHRMLGSLSGAVRRFWRRMVLSAGFMFASYCLLAFAQMVGNWSADAIAFVALLPIAGFAGMIWSVHQYAVDENDEYLRALSIRQLLIASFVTLMLALLWGGLAQAGLPVSNSIDLVILFWFGGLGIGRLYNELRL